MWPCDLKSAIDTWADLCPDRLIQRISPTWNGVIFQSTAGQKFLWRQENSLAPGQFYEIKEQG
jgi:hypothetical protein